MNERFLCGTFPGAPVMPEYYKLKQWLKQENSILSSVQIRKLLDLFYENR